MRGLTRSGGAQPVSSPTVHGTVRFVLLTLVNPMTAVYFAVFAVASGVRLTMLAAAIFVAAVGFSSWCWQAALAVAGGVAGRRLSERHRRWTFIAGYGLVLASGVRLLLAG